MINMVRPKAGVIMVLLLSLCCGRAFAQDETVSEFFSFYFNAYRSGIPDPVQIETLSKLITPEFRRLLLDANRAEMCHARLAHGTEPPLLEGDLFTSLFEGATVGKIAAVRVEGASAEVDVEWSYNAEGDQEAVIWQDRFYLALHAGAWLIDDIAHLGEWEFMYRGRVSALLRDIAGQCREGSD